MNKKIIFVNATSATVGGSLTILKQFVANIEKRRDKLKQYYVFVPLDCEIKSTDYFEIVPIKAKSYKDRIMWDFWGIKKWSDKKMINPHIILSLQNTAVKFDEIPQIIYLHQPLPYAKESKWNFLKKDESKMWFYKHIYKIWIDLTIKKNYKIVVQTQWMKDALMNDGYNENNIIVSRPNITSINVDNIEHAKLENDKVYFFYPAADYKYKNHQIIIEALKLIKKQNPQLLNKIKVLFTLNKESKSYSEVVKYKLTDNIDFLGNLKYEEVLKYYKSTNIVLFPSYIETFGLPLIEGSMFGKKILVSDCSYSRELIETYELADFIEYNNPKDWANHIENSVKGYIENPCNIDNEDGWNKVFDLINCE